MSSSERLRVRVLTAFAATALLLGLSLIPPTTALASTFTVNAVDDAGDGVCDAAHCSLREAIDSANTTAGSDSIGFDPPVFPSASPATISPSSQLPAVTEDVTIDGTGAGVIIDGSGLPGASGLLITGSLVMIRALTIRDFTLHGISICPGGGFCPGDVGGVVIDGVSLLDNGKGVYLDGEDISFVTVRLSRFRGSSVGFDACCSATLRDVNLLANTFLDNDKAIDLCCNGLQNSVIIAFNTISSSASAVGVDMCCGTTAISVHIQENTQATSGGQMLNLCCTGSMSHLQVLENTVMGGTTPGLDLCCVGAITYATIDNNDFSGPEGIDFCCATNVATIQMNSNDLSGAEPLDACCMTNVTGFQLFDNDLSGDEPLDICCQQNVDRLWIVSNNMTGTGTHEVIDACCISDVNYLVIWNNTIAGGGGPGISLSALTGTGSLIDIGPDNVISGNSGPGIEINGSSVTGATDVRIKQNNIVGNGGEGVIVSGDNTFGVTITENSMSDNGQLGIDLAGISDPADGVTANDPLDSDTGPNGLLNFPENLAADGDSVTGTACAGCTVELFRVDADPAGYGEGLEFIDSVTADGWGNFDVLLCRTGSDDQVTATATDGGWSPRPWRGNTSEFSPNVSLAPTIGCDGSTPVPTSTPDPSATSAPSSTPTNTATATNTSTPAPTDTPTPTNSPLATATNSPGSSECADLDNDGAVTARDLVAELRHLGQKNNGKFDLDGDKKVTNGDVIILMGQIGTEC